MEFENEGNFPSTRRLCWFRTEAFRTNKLENGSLSLLSRSSVYILTHSMGWKMRGRGERGMPWMQCGFSHERRLAKSSESENELLMLVDVQLTIASIISASFSSTMCFRIAHKSRLYLVSRCIGRTRMSASLSLRARAGSLSIKIHSRVVAWCVQ